MGACLCLHEHSVVRFLRRAPTPVDTMRTVLAADIVMPLSVRWCGHGACNGAASRITNASRWPIVDAGSMALSSRPWGA
jgi:hypothetical protein